MKILLIGFAKIKYMPYLNFYLNCMDSQQHELHVLYWNRDLKEEKLPEALHFHEFRYALSDDIAKIRKLRSFSAFKSFATKLLKSEAFDFVVVMHSIPAFLLGPYLIKHYAGRFIFDYRDYTYEGIPFFRKRLHKVAQASYCTFVSSDGFRFALPQISKIYTSHNIQKDALSCRAVPTYRPQDPLRIGFWGYIRHEQLNRQIIARLAKDSRFELHFYGKEEAIAQRLKAYVAELKAKNIFFHGEYAPEDRIRFASETELLHNIYSNTEAPSQCYAMTNKYYDGLTFRLPQLAMKNSFMGKVIEKNRVGFPCDPEDPDFADQIWSYYHHLDHKDFSTACDQALQQVLQEYEEGSEIIHHALKPSE